MAGPSFPLDIFVPSFPLERVLAFAEPRSLRAFELTCRQAHAAVTEAVSQILLGTLPASQRALVRRGILEASAPPDRAGVPAWRPRDLYRTLLSSTPQLRWASSIALDRPRFAHTAVAYKAHVYVFGGRHGATYYADVATLALHSCAWLPDTTRGARPSPKRGHTAVVSDTLMYVLGGGSDVLPGTGELHALCLETLAWKALATPPDWSFLGHSCVVTPQRRLVAFGGCWWGDTLKVTDALREYDVATDSWRAPDACGAKPCARYRHSMVPLPSGDGALCVLYGGYVSTWRDGCSRPDGSWAYNRRDMLTLDTRTYAWAQLKLSGPEPLPRGAHSCCALGGSRLLFFGGGILYFDGSEHMEADCSELFAVDTATWTLQAIQAQGAPPRPAMPPATAQDAAGPAARGSHTAMVVSLHGTIGMLVLGGRDYDRDGSVERAINRGRTDGWLLAADLGAAPVPASAEQITLTASRS